MEGLPHTGGLIPDYLERYGQRYLIGIIFGRKTLEEYAKRVLERVRKFDERTGPITIVIGYSMGGLIARYITKRLPTVKKLILVATPNLGIKKLNWWKKLFLWRVKCIKDTLPGSEFLKKLNSEPPLNCKIYLIAGNKDKVVSVESALGIPGVPESQKFILPLEHSELIPPPTSKKQGAIDKIIQICKDP